MIALRGYPRGVFSSLMFCSRRLPMPLSDMVIGNTPLFFFGVACGRFPQKKRVCGLKNIPQSKTNKQDLSPESETDFSYCQDAAILPGALLDGEVRILLMAEHIAQRGVLIRDVFFEGGDVLRCYRGRFLFGLEGCEPVEIGEGDSIVVYPGQRVTIEALDKVNLLVYVIFEGRGVASYFDRLGFFNGIHGQTTTQIELFREVKHRFEAKGENDHTKLMARLSDALVTYAHDLKVGTNAVVSDAIRQIHENLKNGIVRLASLYEQLRIGHTALNHAFKSVGIASPAEFVRQEQLRLVKYMLVNTQKPIAEIASETGFISATHFANFIKRNSGMTAREIRRGGKIVKSRREK